MISRRLLSAGTLAVIFAFAVTTASLAIEATGAIGTQGQVGCGENPKRLKQLSITTPGVYENLLVDGEWIDSTLVKITADNVTLRRCEIRNGRHNAVTVYAKNVVIEDC